MINEIYDNRLEAEPVVFSRSAPQFSSQVAHRLAQNNEFFLFSHSLFDTLVTTKGSVFQIEERIIKPLLSKRANREVYKIIKTFKKTFKEELKTIRNRGWHSLCKNLDDKIVSTRPPHHYSFEGIRNSANDLVNETVYSIANIFHLYKATFKACGTVGPFSDVDYSVTSILKNEIIPTEDAVTYQCIRDLVNIRLFRGLSCRLFDTQSYIPHICSHKLEDNIFTVRGNHIYVAFEITLCLLHAKILYRQTPEKFIALQKKYAKIAEPNLCNSYMAMFSAINEWRDKLDEDIYRQVLRDQGVDDHIVSKAHDILNNDPGAYKRAMLAYTLPIKIMIAREAEAHERKMKSYRTLLDGQIVYQHISIERFKTVLEQGTFAFMIRYSMLKSLEDEATLSSSEGTVTLEADDSQKHQLDIQKAKRRFLARSTSMPVIQRAASPILRSHENKIANELTPNKYKAPLIQTLKIAAFEEVFQFDQLISKYLKLHDDRKAQQGAIIAGKYAFRNTHNNLRALHQYRAEATKKHRNLSSEFIRLERRTHNLAKVSKALERCKRKQTLSKEVLLELLSLRIASTKQSHGGPFGKGAIYRKLDELFSEYERLGGSIGERYMDIRINKRRRFNHIVEKLSSAGLIDTLPSATTSILVPKDPDVEKLLRAWTGSNRLKTTNKDLKQIFQVQDSFTLFYQSLQNHEDVVAFRDEVVQNDFEVMMFLLSKGKVLTPFAVKEHINFLEIWEDAKKRVAHVSIENM